MVLVRNLLFSSLLFVFCCFYIPSPADAGKHHGGNSGLETLLTAGVLAKVLQKGGGGHGGGGHGGGGRSAVMIGGHHHEPRYYGSPAMHYPAPQGHAPMMPPAPYQQPVHYPQHMVHSAPQPIMYNGQQPMAYHGQPANMVPQQRMPYSTQTTNQVSYGHYPEFQPKDKLEVISI